MRENPILKLTANVFAENRDQSINAGKDDFNTKPFRPKLLYTTLLQWLDQPRNGAFELAQILGSSVSVSRKSAGVFMS